jgi:hypothetical protein
MFEPGRPSQEVTGLIARIRQLVAETRELERGAGSGPLEANESEIARLQRRLAAVVKRELAH